MLPNFSGRSNYVKIFGFGTPPSGGDRVQVILVMIVAVVDLGRLNQVLLGIWYRLLVLKQ